MDADVNKIVSQELHQMQLRLIELKEMLGVRALEVNTRVCYVDYQDHVWQMCGEDEDNLLLKQPICHNALIDELEEAHKKWGFEFPLNNGEVK